VSSLSILSNYFSRGNKKPFYVFLEVSNLSILFESQGEKSKENEVKKQDKKTLGFSSHSVDFNDMNLTVFLVFIKDRRVRKGHLSMGAAKHVLPTVAGA
jgi:hypothetical protein